MDTLKDLQNTEAALKDMKMVKKAKLSPTLKRSAEVLVMSMHELRRIAQEQGASLENMTAEHIISDFSRLDGEIERCKKLSEGLFKSK